MKIMDLYISHLAGITAMQATSALIASYSRKNLKECLICIIDESEENLYIKKQSHQ